MGTHQLLRRLTSLGANGLTASALAVVATLVYLQPPTGWLRYGVVHVAPDGFDGFIGVSRRWAVRTIQRAAEIAEPGETILIWPGVYREDVHLRRGGRPGYPLVLRSALPGQAVISGGADPAVMARWQWRPQGAHLWSTPVSWRVDGLRWRGVMAYHSGSLQTLRQICSRPGAWPAFFASARSLWLCLPDGSQPEARQLEVRRPMPQRTRSGGHQVASLWIEAPHVEVRDLRFDFAVMAAVQLWQTHHVHLEGNQFSGADVAINDSPSLTPARAITIERNLSNCYPLYEWGRHGWLSWRELYPYSNCSLVWLHGGDLRVNRNIVFQAGDGIKLTPAFGSNQAKDNLVVETTDDGFEFDGPARDLLVEGNVVINPFVALAPSPVSQGPLLIKNNTVLIFPMEPQVGFGVLLKLMGGAIRNVTLSRNFFLAYRIGNGVADSPVSAVRIEANGFATLTERNDGLAQADQIVWNNNRYLRLDPAGWRQAETAIGALASLGAHPVKLAPLGPAWMDLRRDLVSAPLRPYLGSPWLVLR